jgi:xanthine dehydrogenase YagS FAD-binding subunit
MRPFLYERADKLDTALQISKSERPAYLAGGTTLLDLMKLDVMRPQTVVDINDLAPAHARIEANAQGLYLGALTHMAEAADHPDVLREYPVIAQSLQLAASAQLRNMATLGGNVLQRTRCNYFRDPSWKACNKRDPGSGCAALAGVNRKHAVLGVSDHCIATYPGDFAQALVALDASVEIAGAKATRRIRFEALHRLPGDTPEIETVLAPGELITGFLVPSGNWTRRSLYLKVRDRRSYEFALASAAVALGLRDGIVREARIGLGGVATKPWRAHEAETLLAGKQLTEDVADAAASAAFASARTRDGNAFKPDLGRRTLVRALLQASTMKV